jgi:(R)-2-hydroxyacyl-CoA dehydratese activating ATPase
MNDGVAGMDIGSTTAKCVLLEHGKIMGKSLSPVGVDIIRDGEKALELALADAGWERSRVGFIVGTGYGRYKIYFGQLTMTEISCHAKGAHYLFPNTRIVLDIGGQDTKAIRVSDRGEVVDFSMNDKCAAGTGRFLEVCANALGYDIGQIGPLSLEARHPLKVTSTCTVFAESEVTSFVSRGRDPKDILAGLHASIVNRSLSLMQRVGIEPQLTFTGGVSRNEGMVQALRRRTGIPVNVSPLSQYIGALGAALMGEERLHAGAVQGPQAVAA